MRNLMINLTSAILLTFMCILTKTPDAPSANALNTSVPRLIPPSRKTGILPCTALTTCKFNHISRHMNVHVENLKWNCP